MAKKKAVKRVKAGTSKVAAARRKVEFAKAYIANGCNIKQAAITAGLSAKTAYSAGQRMLKDVVVQALISKTAKKAAKISGLDMERTLLEVARLSYSDPRKLYTKDGNIIPLQDLDDDTAATVASIEHEEIWEGRGFKRKQTGVLKKLKVWDKNAALEKAMKFHGLYKEDNRQKGESLALKVVFGAE